MHLKMFFLNGEKKMHINLWRGIQEDPRDPPSYAAAPGCRAAPPVGRVLPAQVHGAARRHRPTGVPGQASARRW